MKDFLVTLLLYLAWIVPFLTIITAAYFGEFLFAAGVLLGIFFVVFFYVALVINVRA